MEYQRIFDQDDFERMKELRRKQLIQSQMQKRGLKSISAAKQDRLQAAAEDEADDLLEAQVISINRNPPGCVWQQFETE